MARSMLLLVLLTMVAVLAAMAPAAPDRIYVSSEDLESEERLRGLYERWYAVYRREGDPGAAGGGEKEKRFATFKEVARIVHELNEGGAPPPVKHHLNSLADLTQPEYADSFASCSPLVIYGDDAAARARGSGGVPHRPSEYYPDNLPLTVDWRGVEGVLSSVKYQGTCGSCWAMAATGAMESVHFLENKVWATSLSVQQLVDCSGANLGCQGGWASRAFEYVIENKGIDTWRRYPYLAQKVGDCTRPLNHPFMAIKNYYYVVERNEKMLLDAVNRNPVVVSILGANTTRFREYAGGVFGMPCDTTQGGKHESLLVGYGRTPDNDPNQPGMNYWILKNSWGEGWGEGGYMRLQRGFSDDGGVCGILMFLAVYPANAYST